MCIRDRSDVLLFHHQMFHCSPIRCSTVPPSEVLMFHNDCSTVPSSDVFTVPPSVFYCSTMFFHYKKPEVPLFHHHVLLFHQLSSTVPPLDVPLYLFYCSTIRWSTVPPIVLRCSTISVLLFHYLCSTVPQSLFHCSTIRCSTVPPSDVPLFYHQMFHCSTIFVTLFHH